ncbi:hypothetical protein A3C20_01375 [Candidatus Kaiserbacteria bacterium RIFCSPHIGHO2_02_FULL_55_25]|uniref:DUF1573 domain-containing protein n=1 Tax=Candidatus Kaiserbacteria bacterium RIFCSPHIGHO2_02_FULL_55_25 TaxID=1798498 RepID=A0A1F6EAK9_9BACT|nr:MAG: hypothetical protein A2764_00475 [Candidatus Kaiserbacteria bacterium RIFCSPHIGHO2_01_FULL_55_79]OGG70647.1 MAG: hypothetical protein A3C20_01375 [Candidatus Kaiserbacteria bacterium RIFCSPHIGHO2_02_FULL_55_25]OGG78194.1 MAG: hypothetical protein A3F56_00035 [Candidatus Kaiserbacteria bacterium RIFCSPHIGHO2_12_FULL_55_13]OGG82723.1 MAG: hypothetical protein A3A42_02540 [Candidatus Kaiserbacteria bacterium RIFCSPLOWO2_01_FULL_55_25]
MNKTTITIGALIVLGIIGLMVWGKSNASVSGAQSANHAAAPGGSAQSPLTALETFYDFGTISMKKGVVEHRFTVTNNTEASVYLSKVYTSCMCTTGFLETPKGEKGPFGMQGMGYIPPANESIAPGESREVKVIFDPNAHGPAGVGTIDRFVYLEDDKGGMLALEIKAVVTP